MSIDGRVKTVLLNEGGGGQLQLEPHDGGADSPGQPVLFFDSAPEEVTSLNGFEVWGGSEQLMLGDRKVAARRGYTRIEFVDRQSFVEATRRYRERKGLPCHC